MATLVYYTNMSWVDMYIVSTSVLRVRRHQSNVENIHDGCTLSLAFPLVMFLFWSYNVHFLIRIPLSRYFSLFFRTKSEDFRKTIVLNCPSTCYWYIHPNNGQQCAKKHFVFTLKFFSIFKRITHVTSYLWVIIL